VLDKRAISHIHCHDSHMTDASLGSLGSGLGFKQGFFLADTAA
jgi:transketolase N-terminal domain/subunit